MIPQLLTIRYHRKPGRHHRFWIPMLPLYLLLTPLLPLAVVALVIACARYQANPLKVIVALTRLLAALGGIEINIAQQDIAFLVKLI